MGSSQTNELDELKRKEEELAQQLAAIQAEKIRVEEEEKTRVNGSKTQVNSEPVCAKCGGPPIEGCQSGVMKAVVKDEFKGSWLVCGRLKDEDTFFEPNVSNGENKLPPTRPVVSWLAYAESLDGKKRE